MNILYEPGFGCSFYSSPLIAESRFALAYDTEKFIAGTTSISANSLKQSRLVMRKSKHTFIAFYSDNSLNNVDVSVKVYGLSLKLF